MPHDLDHDQHLATPAPDSLCGVTEAVRLRAAKTCAITACADNIPSNNEGMTRL